MAQNYATKYKNGVAREYRIMKKLEKEGLFYIRSAGSHSSIDIMAMKHLPKYEALPLCSIISQSEIIFRFIQSKKTGYLTPQECWGRGA